MSCIVSRVEYASGPQLHGEVGRIPCNRSLHTHPAEFREPSRSNHIQASLYSSLADEAGALLAARAPKRQGTSLLIGQLAPGPRLETIQLNRANSDPDQPERGEPDGRRHAPNLPVATFP